MDIVFDKGSKENSKGHALLYFRSSSAHDEIWCTYLVVLPIAVDVSKYVPPFLMNQVGELGPKDLSAFAFPPAPEKVDSYGHLEELAAKRDDDVLFGGTINPTDVAAGMMSVNEAVQWYSEICSESSATSRPAGLPSPDEAAGLGVNEVLYGLMSDVDKLSELTKLVGKVRYATEGSEKSLIQDAEVDINLLANHLPQDHQVQRLVEVAKYGGSRGQQLADLYLRRCYLLMQEEFSKLVQVEEEIRTLEAADPS